MARVEQQSASAIAHELERSVADAFVEAGWEVEKEPSIGPLRPDLLLTSPKGEHLAVEVKASTAPVHFGTVAQVAEYATLAGAVEDLSAVRSVLLTTAPLSVAARDAADKLGVQILGQERLARKEIEPKALARYWVQCLAATSEASYKKAETRSASAKEDKVQEVRALALERSVAHRRALLKRLLIGVVVIGLGIAVAIVLANQGFGGETHPTTKSEGGAAQGEASGSASSPLVPILIAVGVLAAISVGAVIMRSRRLGKRQHHSHEGAA